MKKYKIFFITSSALIILGIIFLFMYLVKLPPDIPERQKNIPASAVWHGGSDGGWWYDLVSVKNSIFRFRIYNENTGNLITDSDFLAEGECLNVIKRERNIHNLISHYGNNIIIVAKDGHEYTLKKIYSYQ